jgi:hypothetical protein
MKNENELTELTMSATAATIVELKIVLPKISYVLHLLSDSMVIKVWWGKC